jgi:hypothetical protein
MSDYFYMRLLIVFVLTALISPQAFAQAKTTPKAAPQLARIPAPGPAELPLLPAQDFSDSRGTIELSLPTGWNVAEIPNPQKTPDASLILLDGPGSPSANCRVIVKSSKQPPKITQAQINKAMHDERNLQNMRKSLGQNGREVLALAKLSNKGIYGLQAKLLVPGNEYRADMTVLISYFEAVGQAYSFECTVTTADFDNAADDLDSIVKSARLSAKS